MVEALLWIAALVGIAWLATRLKRRRTHVGSAAVGSVYDMLNEDKRHAVELVVEGRAEARDPEHADGNLPDLDDPRGRG
jgi:hypothetical protein